MIPNKLYGVRYQWGTATTIVGKIIEIIARFLRKAKLALMCFCVFTVLKLKVVASNLITIT